MSDLTLNELKQLARDYKKKHNIPISKLKKEQLIDALCEKGIVFETKPSSLEQILEKINVINVREKYNKLIEPTLESEIALFETYSENVEKYIKEHEKEIDTYVIAKEFSRKFVRELNLNEFNKYEIRLLEFLLTEYQISQSMYGGKIKHKTYDAKYFAKL